MIFDISSIKPLDEALDLGFTHTEAAQYVRGFIHGSSESPIALAGAQRRASFKIQFDGASRLATNHLI